MFKFAVALWNPHIEVPLEVERALRIVSAERSGFRVTFSGPGCVVCCAMQEPNTLRTYSLEARHGLVIGRLFQSSSNRDAPTLIDGAETNQIVSTQGRHLVHHYWGNYVALINTAQETHVVKDPTGSLPCYYAEQSGWTLVFSCVSIPRAIGIRMKPNNSYINARLFGSTAAAGVAPFENTHRLHGGECLTVGSHKPSKIRIFWTPRHFAPDYNASVSTCSNWLRAEIQRCTSAWIEQGGSVLHRLSGGLDSSIILACLAKCSPAPNVLSYTYFQDHAANDERPWARLAAQAAGCKQIEWKLDPTLIDLSIARSMPQAVEPLSVLPYYQRTRIEAHLSARHGAKVVFNGEGGDSGFGGDSISTAIPESLHYRGLHPGLLRLAHSVAMHTKRSVSEELLAALGHHKACTQAVDLGVQLSTRAVHPDLRAAPPPQIHHPWLEADSPVNAFIIPRLGSLLGAPRLYDHAGDSPDIISPLYAQPVIETVLRIPVEHLFFNGRERGLARCAFRGDVPQPILQRLWKDRAPTFSARLVAANRDWLREVLLDGVLVREGKLDRRILEHALSARSRSASTVYPTELMKHLDTEIWLQSWLESPPRQLAATHLSGDDAVHAIVRTVHASSDQRPRAR
jgi:asparagine synthase (glutamine-hydrolysing)